MPSSQIARARRVSAPSSPSAALESLAGAITAEVRLLEDLVGIMRRQRAAVAEDDLQGVDDSVFAIHRVLVTMAEARRHRRALAQLVGAPEEMGLRELEDLLGEQMTDELRFARDGLRAVALTLSREVETNRQVLREALQSSAGLVRSLFTGGEAPGGYGVNVRRVDADTSGGVLINRRA